MDQWSCASTLRHLDTTPVEFCECRSASQEAGRTMRSLWSGMERRMASTIGASRTRGALRGARKATSGWNATKTHVISTT